MTAILAHGGNLYQDKVPTGFAVGNGYGKFIGSTQIAELGELETPILLTNTLNVAEAAAGIVEWTLRRPGNEEVRSVNAVVGETNDGFLNDIRARRVTAADAIAAIDAAREGPVAEGAVGAGTGTIAFGWKGGIGTSSRRLPATLGAGRSACSSRPIMAACSPSTAPASARRSAAIISAAGSGRRPATAR